MESSDEIDSDGNSINESLKDDDDGELMEINDIGDEETGEKQKDAEDKEDENEEGKAPVDKKPKRTRIVTNPRVVLNLERLKSANGFEALINTFEDFKFKGKHHEKEDLTLVMQKLQHWVCHNLYPGYDFETSLGLLEKLGKKRAVQSHLRRMRMESSERVRRNVVDDKEGKIPSVTEDNFDYELTELNEVSNETVEINNCNTPFLNEDPEICSNSQETTVDSD